MALAQQVAQHNTSFAVQMPLLGTNAKLVLVAAFEPHLPRSWQDCTA